MSMIGNYSAIKPETLASFLADPSLIDKYLYPEDGTTPGEFYMDIDKAWHGIHFLLNGDTWDGEPPLLHVVLGGELMGEDVGYGPARVLTVEQVAQVSAALQTITRDEFSVRYNSAELSKNEIYPDIWDDAVEEDEDDNSEYLTHYFEQVKHFFAKSAENGWAALTYLS